MKFAPTFVISVLNSSRYFYMKKQVTHWPFPTTFLTEQYVVNVNGEIHTKGKTFCLSSHVNAIRKSLTEMDALNSTYSIILEDDVAISEANLSELSKLEFETRNWDFILLAYHADTLTRRRIKKQHTYPFTTKGNLNAYGTPAYAISRRAALDVTKATQFYNETVFIPEQCPISSISPDDCILSGKIVKKNWDIRLATPPLLWHPVADAKANTPLFESSFHSNSYLHTQSSLWAKKWSAERWRWTATDGHPSRHSLRTLRT